MSCSPVILNGKEKQKGHHWHYGGCGHKYLMWQIIGRHLHFMRYFEVKRIVEQ